ncbi:MAG: hypothetical protein ACKOC6_10095 [bacterium]
MTLVLFVLTASVFAVLLLAGILAVASLLGVPRSPRARVLTPLERFHYDDRPEPLRRAE